ncbi:MAG TPA: hypothetical protein DDX98_10510 [Bacteroidales bacterium]|nr:hypothetical protein [Bacteroidales bacterium]
MKRIFTHLFLFLLPFILNTVIVYIVDPYNIIYKSHIVPDEAKYKCIRRTAATIPRGQVPWKMAEFERNPKANVVFGDSRMTHLNAKYFTEQTGEEMYNFSIAGGNLKTAIDLFWFSTEHINLKRAFFQIGFINFNDNVNYEIVSPYFKFKQNSLNYFNSRSVCIDTYSVLYYLISGNENFADIEYRERNIDLWQRGFDLVDFRLTDFIYPENYLSEFKKIFDYCKQNNIELKFIHIPNHESFEPKIVKHNKEAEYQGYFNDLNNLGGLISPKEELEAFTSNKENYKDVFHFYPSFADSISNAIWRKYLETSRLSEL